VLAGDESIGTSNPALTHGSNLSFQGRDVAAVALLNICGRPRGIRSIKALLFFCKLGTQNGIAVSITLLLFSLCDHREACSLQRWYPGWHHS
jgi:hypothetical protein